MTETRVSIGRAKREISEPANRAACGGERMVLISRGKTQSTLVILKDELKPERGRERGQRIGEGL